MQEIPDIPSNQNSQSNLPPSHLSGLSNFTQNAIPSGSNQPPPQNLAMPPSSQNLPSNTNLQSAASYVAPPSHLQPSMADPLQSLKDVKVRFVVVFFLSKCCICSYLIMITNRKNKCT